MSGDALHKRHEQGWVLEVTSDLDTCVSMIRAAKNERRATSIGYHGNIVDLWLELNYALHNQPTLKNYYSNIEIQFLSSLLRFFLFNRPPYRPPAIPLSVRPFIVRSFHACVFHHYQSYVPPATGSVWWRSMIGPATCWWTWAPTRLPVTTPTWADTTPYRSDNIV